MKATVLDLQGECGFLIKDEDSLHFKNYEEEIVLSKEIISNEIQKYFFYERTNSFWTKMEINAKDYETLIEEKLTNDILFSDYAYNEELKAYEGDYDFLYFEGSKLVKIVSDSDFFIFEYGDEFVVKISEVE